MFSILLFAAAWVACLANSNEYYSYSAVGAGGGTLFLSKGGGSITGVKVWEHPGNFITGFQLRYGNVWHHAVGNAYHEPQILVLFEGETITQLSGKYTTYNYIYQVIFVTSRGRSLIVGQPVQTSFNLYPQHPEAELRMLSGRFDGSGIKSLGAHWGIFRGGYGNSTDETNP